MNKKKSKIKRDKNGNLVKTCGNVCGIFKVRCQKELGHTESVFDHEELGKSVYRGIPSRHWHGGHKVNAGKKTFFQIEWD